MDFIDSIAIGKNVRVNREKEKTGYTIHKIRWSNIPRNFNNST